MGLDAIPFLVEGDVRSALSEAMMPNWIGALIFVLLLMVAAAYEGGGLAAVMAFLILGAAVWIVYRQETARKMQAERLRLLALLGQHPECRMCQMYRAHPMDLGNNDIRSEETLWFRPVRNHLTTAHNIRLPR